MKDEFTHTVHCFDDRSLRKHFAGIEKATKYANKLLSQGHKVKLYPYKAVKKRIDYIAENPEAYR